MDEKNLKNHDFFLKEALEEAKKAYGFTSPNPSVGAVAVKNNQIIARGYHQGPGEDHAEIMVLNQLPPNLSGVSLYVTLEPCGHWGRTPPCVDAIIAYGIEKVIYAYDDPNPVVKAHLGGDKLIQHQIELLHYPLSEIDAFYASYTYWQRYQKPYVTAKWAQSLDAKVALPGERIHLSNQYAFQFTHESRLKSDVLLTSAKTIEIDDPLFNVRLVSETFDKPLAIIDSHLRLTGKERVFSCKRPVIIYHHLSMNAQTPIEGVFYQGITGKLGQLNLDEIIHDLGKRGYHNVWVEAGPQLMNALHHQRLVNRTHIYISPKVIGVKGINAFEEVLLIQNQSLQWHGMDDNIRLSVEWQMK
jgi:diaminohydroxyphosphoribosylaminopyrimidine deaminase/5-amino-6-(5-phosphoribosylamino)uracil reductase